MKLISLSLFKSIDNCKTKSGKFIRRSCHQDRGDRAGIIWQHETIRNNSGHIMEEAKKEVV